MALSGTLETFSLPDVLRLLSSTKKTGLLALDGDRGTGRIWVAEGSIVAAAADRAVVDEIDGVLFELLRFREASFAFEPGTEPLAPSADPRAVDDAIDAAELRLAEWHDIEAVVPSLDVWVNMVAELDDDVTVSPTQWRVLANVGTGVRGHRLAAALEQGEFDVCRQLRDLIEAGLLELGEAPIDEPEPSRTMDAPVGLDDGQTLAEETFDEPSFAEPALSSHEVSSLGDNLASFVAAGTPDQPLTDDQGDLDDEPHETSWEVEDGLDDDLDDADQTTNDEPTLAEPSPVTSMIDIGVDEPETGDEAAAAPDDAGDHAEADDDFLSQLSHLSPKAAAAIEATSSPDERGDDTDESDEIYAESAESGPEAHGDEDIDQNLLLRFLSSAKQ